MSIESRLKYRKEFLQSEEWAGLRALKMARDGHNCDICGRSGNGNDVHHVFYPKNWNQTSVGDLVVLCRSCHSNVHEYKLRKAQNQTQAWSFYVKVRKRIRATLRKVESDNPECFEDLQEARNRFTKVKTRLFTNLQRLGVSYKIGFARSLRLVLEKGMNPTVARMICEKHRIT